MQEVKEILPAGSIVRGRYQVEKLLGKGGFGAVYLVRDQRVRQNLFALKEVIDPNKRERDRFTFEAELLKRVDHPSLPRVYRVIEDDQHDRAYMLMDYIDGLNLEKLRQQQPEKRFPVQQVLSIMGPIMDAVSYLHKQNPPIIHRDIKPANIIAPTSGDEAVLVDFGIAKVFDPESTTTAVRHASPGYGAPEQYATGTNTRTDIYGLGATMYALLTGIVPVDAFYRITQLGSRGTDPLEPIQRYAPDVPQHVANAIYRAMSIDIDERFPTAQEFWQALNAQPLPAVAAVPFAPIAALGASHGTVSRLASANIPIVPPDAPTTEALPERREGRRRRLGAWLLLLLALLIASTVAALLLPALLSHHPNAGTITPTVKATHGPGATVTHTPAATVTHTPTTTPPPSPTKTVPPGGSPGPGIPILDNTYNGTIHNTPANVNSSMSLNSIKQSGGNMQGNFVVGSGLLGSGPFSGTVKASGAVQFTVRSSQVAPLWFLGSIQSDGSLSGTYCSLNPAGKCDTSYGGYGSWHVFSVTGSGSLFSFLLPTLS